MHVPSKPAHAHLSVHSVSAASCNRPVKPPLEDATRHLHFFRQDTDVAKIPAKILYLSVAFLLG